MSEPSTMRLATALALGLSLAFAAAPALAESRIFIVASNSDGYGVDRCLATGASCGAAVATAYCRSQSFDEARSYRKAERSEITGAVPQGGSICLGACEEFVVIECAR
jgi:hypothetical protein